MNKEEIFIILKAVFRTVVLNTKIFNTNNIALLLKDNQIIQIKIKQKPNYRLLKIIKGEESAY